MNHFVNFGLLFSFLTLAVSGVLSFVNSFSLLTARIHIVFAITTLVFIALHLYTKIKYFKKHTKPKLKLIVFLLLGWSVIFTATWLNYPPVNFIIAQSYEAQHKKEIVRTNPLVASLADDKTITTSRQEKNTNTTALSVYITLGVKMKNPPAITIWSESKNGTMIETLFMSEGLAYSDKPQWFGKETPRHHIFPVWRHRYTTINGLSPDGKIDTTSGATQNHHFSLDANLKSDGEPFVIFIEINAPGDTDKKWTDSHLGQPSVLYSVYVEPKNKQKYYLLELTGQGSEAIADGAINYDLESIGDAKDLLDIALVKLELPN